MFSSFLAFSCVCIWFCNSGFYYEDINSWKEEHMIVIGLVDGLVNGLVDGC